MLGTIYYRIGQVPGDLQVGLRNSGIALDDMLSGSEVSSVNKCLNNLSQEERRLV